VSIWRGFPSSELKRRRLCRQHCRVGSRVWSQRQDFFDMIASMLGLELKSRLLQHSCIGTRIWNSGIEDPPRCLGLELKKRCLRRRCGSVRIWSRGEDVFNSFESIQGLELKKKRLQCCCIGARICNWRRDIISTVLGFGVEEKMSPAFLRRFGIWSWRRDVFSSIVSVVGLGVGEGFVDTWLYKCKILWM
jgi:hypothetical protein